MAGAYTVLSHTADTGIAVEADTLGELIEWSARGMFGLMYDIDRIAPVGVIEVFVESGNLEDLVVDVLAELLYRAEAEDLVPCAFSVGEVAPTFVRLEVCVAPIRAGLLEGPPIKAVTYHGLVAEQAPDGTWAAQVVFDV